MNVSTLKNRFADLGIIVHLLKFPEVNLNDDWAGRVVLYQSSEDPDLQYKSYIEDMVLGLSLAGAHIVPGFPYLRAHHNKSFWEIFRKVSRVEAANTLSSQIFGTYEDFASQSLQYPCVAKKSYGAGSAGVMLLPSEQESKRIVKRISKSSLCLNTLEEFVKRLIRKEYMPYSLNRNKFITQEFIPNLTHDYKILLYGQRAFVVRREVGDNDFRASGSGRLSWPRDIPIALLDFAWTIYSGFDVPHVSLDIAESNQSFHLIEAQFVDFGPAALERSNHHWERGSEGWKLIDGNVELERTFAEGIVAYSKNKGWLAG